MLLTVETLSITLGIISLLMSLWKLFSVIQNIKTDVLNCRHDIQINSINLQSMNNRIDSKCREIDGDLTRNEKKLREIENYLAKNGYVSRD